MIHNLSCERVNYAPVCKQIKLKEQILVSWNRFLIKQVEYSTAWIISKSLQDLFLQIWAKSAKINSLNNFDNTRLKYSPNIRKFEEQTRQKSILKFEKYKPSLLCYHSKEQFFRECGIEEINLVLAIPFLGSFEYFSYSYIQIFLGKKQQ